MAANCAHHWMLDEPTTPLCYGKCKLCGMERNDFLNVADWHGYEFHIKPTDMDIESLKQHHGKQRWTGKK